MHFGTLMGVYWIVKFAFFPMGLTNSLFSLIFMGLTIAVPFIAYKYVRLVRDKVCGGFISFTQSWLFLVFMFMFAALLAAAGHYIYFRYIDNGYILNTYSAVLESENFKSDIPDGFDNYLTAIKETLELVGAMTPIEKTMQLLSSNMFCCSLLSLIIAPFVAKKKSVSV